MRTQVSPDLSILRSEVAARLGLPSSTQRLRLRAGVPLLPLRPPLARRRRVPALRRARRACSGSRSRESGTATRAGTSSASPPARSSTARTCRVWKWFVAVHLMTRDAATASPRTSFGGRSAGATRRRGSRRTGSASRCAAAAAELLRSLVDAELGSRAGAESPPRGIVSWRAPTAGCSRECAASSAARTTSSATKYLPAYIDERRWLRRTRTTRTSSATRSSALVGGEGLSYDQLVAAR